MKIMRRLAGLSALALLCLVVLVSFIRHGAEPRAAIRPAAIEGELDGGLAPGLRADENRVKQELRVAQANASSAETEASRSGAEAAIEPAQIAEELELYPLRLQFILPDGAPAKLKAASAILTLDEERSWTCTERRASDELLGELPFGIYRLRVTVEGYRHMPETLDFSSAICFESGDPKRGFFARIYLWSEDWIPVILRTKDGRSFETISEDRGIEGKRYFVDAFRFFVSYEPVTAAQVLPDRDDEVDDVDEDALAHFRPAHGYQNVLIGDDMIGSLQLLAPRPFWVSTLR